MLKVGITGNIASGKSEIVQILKEKNFIVFDFDVLTHNLFLDEKIRQQLKKEFKTIDKKEISKIVFKDGSKRKTLEKIIHPELYKKAQELFLEYKNEEFIFFEGALIYEAGFDKLFDKIIYVDADFMLRLKRLKERNNFDDKSAMIRLNCQTTLYKSKADFIIMNNDSKESLKNETMKIISSLS